VTVIHPVYAGKALLKLKLHARPAILSLRPNVFTPVPRPKAGRSGMGYPSRIPLTRTWPAHHLPSCYNFVTGRPLTSRASPLYSYPA